MIVERDQATAQVGTITTWLRYLLIAVAWLFVIAAVVQVFLAGLSLFDSPKYWEDHKDFGNSIGILPLLLPILAIAGRMGMPFIGHAFVVLILYIVQIILPEIDTGWIAALHPVNAFFLIGSAGSLGARALALVRPSSRQAGAPATAAHLEYE
jgi:hypothetical protein